MNKSIKTILLSSTMVLGLGLSNLRADYTVFGTEVSNKTINGKEDTRWLNVPKGCRDHLLALVKSAETATELNEVKAQITNALLSESNQSQEAIFNNIRQIALNYIATKSAPELPASPAKPVVAPATGGLKATAMKFIPSKSTVVKGTITLVSAAGIAAALKNETSRNAMISFFSKSKDFAEELGTRAINLIKAYKKPVAVTALTAILAVAGYKSYKWLTAPKKEAKPAVVQAVK